MGNKKKISDHKKKAPPKKFYNLKLDNYRMNQILPITSQRNVISPDCNNEAFAQREIQNLQLQRVIKMKTVNRKVSHLDWEKYTKELHRWDSDDEL